MLTHDGSDSFVTIDGTTTIPLIQKILQVYRADEETPAQFGFLGHLTRICNSVVSVVSRLTNLGSESEGSNNSCVANARGVVAEILREDATWNEFVSGRLAKINIAETTPLCGMRPNRGTSLDSDFDIDGLNPSNFSVQESMGDQGFGFSSNSTFGSFDDNDSDDDDDDGEFDSDLYARYGFAPQVRAENSSANQNTESFSSFSFEPSEQEVENLETVNWADFSDNQFQQVDWADFGNINPTSADASTDTTLNSITTPSLQDTALNSATIVDESVQTESTHEITEQLDKIDTNPEDREDLTHSASDEFD